VLIGAGLFRNSSGQSAGSRGRLCIGEHGRPARRAHGRPHEKPAPAALPCAEFRRHSTETARTETERGRVTVLNQRLAATLYRRRTLERLPLLATAAPPFVSLKARKRRAVDDRRHDRMRDSCPTRPSTGARSFSPVRRRPSRDEGAGDGAPRSRGARARNEGPWRGFVRHEIEYRIVPGQGVECGASARAHMGIRMLILLSRRETDPRMQHATAFLKVGLPFLRPEVSSSPCTPKRLRKLIPGADDERGTTCVHAHTMQPRRYLSGLR